jgi:peroxiredoxin (alkyl hydroperoxide reductase subunit C)
MFRRNKPTVREAATHPAKVLPPGMEAPDFTLPSAAGEGVSLRDFRGQPVILAFYPADFSPVCGDQLVLYNEVQSLFGAYNARLLAISVDGVWCHKAFVENRNLSFPLLSDYEPKGAVAQAYGVYDAEKGSSQRALFVIDAQGFIRWSYVSPSGVNPGADGILNALESL